MLTVRELITELRKYPGDLLVTWSDHDSSEFEVTALPAVVNIVDFDKRTPEDSINFEFTGETVNIRP